MFKSTNAKNTQEYLAMLPDERRNILEQLDKIIRNTAPQLRDYFAYNMPGYGSFTYTNYKKEEIQWPIISMASQKNYVSVYVCAVLDGQYIAEKYKDELGKVSVGKSCIRFKKIEDLNLETFQKVVQAAVANPGLVSANGQKN